MPFVFNRFKQDSLDALVFNLLKSANIVKSTYIKHETVIPIPITKIVKTFKIDIIKTPDLMKKNNGIEGICHPYRKIINVDKHQFDNDILKGRFTLAHEFAHFILHSYIALYSYEGDKNKWTPERHREYLNSEVDLPQLIKEVGFDKVPKTIKAQADDLAGSLLMPQWTFIREYRRLLAEPENRDEILEEEKPIHILKYSLSDIFQVSPDVAEIRFGNIQYKDDFEKAVEYEQKISSEEPTQLILEIIRDFNKLLALKI